MKRRLVVMRHATAASGANLPTDHERPLTRYGSRQAEDVGRQLAALDWVPRVALVSDAARTTETWWCMEGALGSPAIDLLPGFYCAGVDAMVGALKRRPDSERTVLVLGHNPGWSEAIDWLCGELVALSPGDAALLVGEGSRWSDALGYRALRLDRVLRPEVDSG